MKYYIKTKEEIETASNLCYRLSRPEAIEETANDITSFQFGWIKHPNKLEFAAWVDLESTIPIHQHIKDSISSGNGVSAYFDNVYPTQEEADEKKQLCLDNARVFVIDLLPSNWDETPKAELEAGGWFSEVELN